MQVGTGTDSVGRCSTQQKNRSLLSRLFTRQTPVGTSLPTNPQQQQQHHYYQGQQQAGGPSSRNVSTAAAAAVAASATASCSTKTDVQWSTPDLGFARNLEERFTWGRELGKGGNGLVRLVVDKDGTEYACKSVRKVLQEGTDRKKAGHIESLKREISVLQKLKGSLNIIELEAVYEDEEHVHIVQEYCQGGELVHAIGQRPYTERTVASYMRAVLRTLAQCHAHHILHRDIKPGNFMLLSKDERAPLRAIDFGLATPYEQEDLPLTNLGMEGTPWFMAPEVLSSSVTPASDLWSAGVMAYQLLTGMLPFDDHRCPFSPSITAIWRSILCDSPGFDKPWWSGVSDEAKDFVAMLLNRDPAKRPTAKEALKHPWLRGNSAERSTGKQLQRSVVQRIQRYAGSSTFKRSILQMIASELLSHPELVPVDACVINDRGRPIVPNPGSACLEPVYRQLKLDKAGAEVNTAQAAEALKSLGFTLSDAEVERLLSQLDPAGTGAVARSAFAASQVDWRHLQQYHQEAWKELVHKAFQSLDHDADGVLRMDEIVSHLAKLAPGEADLRAAMQQAMEEAGQATDNQGMDFNDFMRMLKISSVDSLDMYDDRLLGSTWSNGSVERLNALLQRAGSSGSRHGGTGSWRAGLLLDSSHHSDTSTATGAAADRTVHQMFEFDKSQHGLNLSQHNNSSTSGQGAAGALLRSSFRFDVGGSNHGPAPQPSPFHFDVGGAFNPYHSAGKSSAAQPQQQAVAAPVAAAAGAGSFFRFDVAGPQSHVPPPPPPPPAAAAPLMMWRFDVGGPAVPSSSSSAAALPQQQQQHPAAAQQQPPAAVGDGVDLLQAAATGLGLARNGGGHFDRRHHGSSLYKNSLTGGGTTIAAAACRPAGMGSVHGGSMHGGRNMLLATVQE